MGSSACIIFTIISFSLKVGIMLAHVQLFLNLSVFRELKMTKENIFIWCKSKCVLFFFKENESNRKSNCSCINQLWMAIVNFMNNSKITNTFFRTWETTYGRSAWSNYHPSNLSIFNHYPFMNLWSELTEYSWLSQK